MFIQTNPKHNSQPLPQHIYAPMSTNNNIGRKSLSSSPTNPRGNYPEHYQALCHTQIKHTHTIIIMKGIIMKRLTASPEN